MPNRVLREGILESYDVDKLNWAAEVFYRRLMSKVDDFGRFSADVRLLRAALYPLKLDKVSDRDTQGWLQATEKAGLVKVYEVDGKSFLELQKFNQRVRSSESKYPAPPENDSHVTDTCQTDDRHMTVTCQTNDSHVTDTCPPKTKTESETETESNKASLSTARAREESEPMTKTPQPPRDGQAASVDAVVTYLASRVEITLVGEALHECAYTFFAEMEGCGWVDHKRRQVQDWRALARLYASKWQRNLTEPQLRMNMPKNTHNQKTRPKDDYKL